LDSLKHKVLKPPRPHRLWGPASLLPNVYQALFPWRQSGRGVKLTTHIHLVREAIPPLFQYVFMEWCLVKRREDFILICRCLKELALNIHFHTTHILKMYKCTDNINSAIFMEQSTLLCYYVMFKNKHRLSCMSHSHGESSCVFVS